MGHGASSIVIVTIMVHLGLMLDDRGFSLGTIGLVVSTYTGLNAVFVLVGGYVGSRVPVRYALFGFSALQSGAVAVLLVAGDDALLVFLFAVLLGVGFGGRNPLTSAIRGTYFGRKDYATITGLGMVIMNVFLFTAPVVAGYISYDTAFAGVAVVCLLGSGLFLFLGDPKPPPAPRAGPGGTGLGCEWLGTPIGPAISPAGSVWTAARIHRAGVGPLHRHRNAQRNIGHHPAGFQGDVLDGARPWNDLAVFLGALHEVGKRFHRVLQGFVHRVAHGTAGPQGFHVGDQDAIGSQFSMYGHRILGHRSFPSYQPAARPIERAVGSEITRCLGSRMVFWMVGCQKMSCLRPCLRSVQPSLRSLRSILARLVSIHTV